MGLDVKHTIQQNIYRTSPHNQQASSAERPVSPLPMPSTPPPSTGNLPHGHGRCRRGAKGHGTVTVGSGARSDQTPAEEAVLEGAEKPEPLLSRLSLSCVGAAVAVAAVVRCSCSHRGDPPSPPP